MTTYRRPQAGYYTATINGRSIEIEAAARAIEGGRGWVVWVDGVAPSAELPTLAAAKAAAERQARS
jgi:hypothetical protein